MDFLKNVEEMIMNIIGLFLGDNGVFQAIEEFFNKIFA